MSYAHISTNMTETIQKGTTVLKKIVVGTTGSAWNISIYDGVDSSGNLVAVINASDGGNYDFECMLAKGLYVSTSGTTPGDATIVYE